MADNLLANIPRALICKTAVSVAAAGISATNMNKVYLIGDPFKSVIPGQPFPSFTSFVEGEDYLFYPKQNMDLSTWFYPPLDGVSLPGNNITDHNNQAITDHNGQNITE